MREALIKVLKAEGEKDPDPRVFIAAHYFSDSHGVQPKEKALGAKSCYDCHGDYHKNPGAHRITDRNIVFIPYAPPFMNDKYRFSKDNPNGLFVVDKDIKYIHPMEANGLRFIGATEKEILEDTKKDAEELFYIAAEGTVPSGQIGTELGVDDSNFTKEELNTEYVRQIVNGPWNDKHYFYIPKELKPKIKELGFVPGKVTAYVEKKGFVEGYELKVDIENDANKSFIIMLPYMGDNPAIFIKKKGDKFFRLDKKAKILGYRGIYLIVKVNENGEYIAGNVEGTCGVMGKVLEPWRK